jgi:hypothetical protein
MNEDLVRINKKLIDVLSSESGYFGWVRMWWNGPKKYEYIGFELSEDIQSTLEGITEDQRRNLVRIINYFEMHARPLKSLLNSNEDDGLYQMYAEIAWAHFMTVIMFGMLEVSLKDTPWAQLDKRGYLRKKISIKKFLEDNLSDEIKSDIVKRYKSEENSHHKVVGTFSEIIDHLWDQIRSGFVHDAGMESKGLEWQKISGWGTQEDPITFTSDVPMPEWLQVTWQAILNSYGYKGIIRHPTLRKIDLGVDGK